MQKSQNKQIEMLQFKEGEDRATMKDEFNKILIYKCMTK